MKKMEVLEQIESNNKVESVDKTTQVNVFDYFSKKALPQTAHKYFETLDVSKVDDVIKKQISMEQGISVDDLTKEHIFTSYIRSAVRKSKDFTNKSDDYIFAKINEKIAGKKLLTYAEKRFFQWYISDLGSSYSLKGTKIFTFCDAVIGTGTMGQYRLLANAFKSSGSVSLKSYLRSQVVAVEMKYETFPRETQSYIDKQKAFDLLDVDGRRKVCASYLKQNYSEKLQDYHICAILANMSFESRFSTYISGDKGTSDGLCQWHDTSLGVGRLTNLKNFSKQRNIPRNYFGVQLDFLIHELGLPKYKNFLAQANLTDATRFFVYTFESPTNKEYKYSNQRLPLAKTYAKTGIKIDTELSGLITEPTKIETKEK